MSLKGGSNPTPPAPPDPNQVAQAQANASTTAARGQQALNAVDQNNPWGSLSYRIDPNTGRLTQNTTLNSALQGQLSNQQAGNFALSNAGLAGLHGATQGLSQPFNIGQAGATQSNVQGGPIQSSLGGYGGIQNNANHIQTNLNPNVGQLNYGQNVGNVTGGSAYHFNTAGMPNLNQDYGQQAEHAFQLALQAQLPVLNQLQGREQSALDAKLAGQGFVDPNQAGYQNQQHDLALNQGQQYNQLANQAFGAGLNAQGQLFNENLGARQQLFGEQSTQAQNAMQAQQLNEQASAQNAANQLSKAGLQNQAVGQQFGQNYASGQFRNQALGQQYNQNLGAQNQQYQQALGSGLFGLGAQQQQFGQGMQNAALNNQTTQQNIQNMMLQRQYPLQEAQQLLGAGGGAQMPQFGSAPQAGVQAPNIGQYYYNNYQAAQDAYNQQIASRNQGQAGMFGLGSSLIGGLLG